MEQQIIANGGLQYVSQIAVQYVYLDFDGELTSYNGEILTIDHVEVKDSSLTKERIANIVAELNAKYAAQNVIFVSERPTTAEYSTIFVGKTEAFSPYGNFAGLAETIDHGNQIKNDNAFVMLDSTASDETLISTISHETDHLLGTLNHGGEGIKAYAEYYYVLDGETSTGVTLNKSDYMYISYDGTANSTTVNASGKIYISYGGICKNAVVNNGGLIDVHGNAYDIVVNNGGSLYVSGVATGIIENGGYVHYLDVEDVSFVPNTISGAVLTEKATVHSVTVASDVIIDSGGLLFVSDGGRIHGTIINSSGEMVIYGGVFADSTTVNSSGLITVNGKNNISNTIINKRGLMYIEGDTILSNTIVRGGLYLSNCTIADKVQIDNTGSMIMYGSNSDCYVVANDIVVNGGIVFLEDYSSAFDAVLTSSGFMQISYGCSADNVQIYDSSVAVVSGNITNVHIEDGGEMWVIRGGESENSIVSNGGFIYGSANAVLNNTTVLSGGSIYNMGGGVRRTSCTFSNMIIKSGGTLNCGNYTILSGDIVVGGRCYTSYDTVEVDAYRAKLTLDLTERNSSDDFMFDHLYSTLNYFITVRADQQPGKYKLAESYPYVGSMTLKCGDDSAILKVNTNVVLNNGSYTLLDENDSLYLTIGRLQPDLTVNASFADTEVISGESSIITITVTNNGQCKANASVGKIYNKDDVIFTFDIPELDAGESYSCQNVFYTNPDFSGIYSATVKVDADEIIEESDEENNTAQLELKVLSKPDLKVSAIELSDDNIYYNENTLCNFTVVNDGDTDSGSFYISIYVNGNKIDSIFVENLNANLAYSGHIDFPAETFEPGKYNISVFADSANNVLESDESNNRASVELNVEGLPDLEITECKFNPYLVKKGGGAFSSLEISYTNSGNEASGPCVISVYKGTNLVDTIRIDGLGVGKSDSVITNIDLKDCDYGTHYFNVTVDGEFQVKESDELNNSALADVFVDLPDLVISDFSISKDVIVKNGFAMLSFRVKNQGEVSAEASYAYVYMGDEILFKLNTPYLPAGAEYLHFAVISSIGEEPGNYDITMVADGGKNIEEVFENNNSATLYIAIEEKQHTEIEKNPDLTIEFFELQEQLDPDKLEFVFTVGNIGNDIADKSLLYIYVDNEKIQEIKVDELEPDKVFSGTFSLLRNAYAKGEHTVMIQADGAKQIDESDEKNNTKSLSFTIADSGSTEEQSRYIFNYSQDDFEHYIQVETNTPQVDIFGIPAGTYQWRYREYKNLNWHNEEDINSQNTPFPAEKLVSDNNRHFDLFFAEKCDVWSKNYEAQHSGIINGWQGSMDKFSLAGKNKFSDIFIGSSDANVLVLTDDSNGDALFLDDIFSAFGDQPRLTMLDEIRAGDGDDIIDLTSQRFSYVGDSTLTIYGGNGNDIIWSNSCKNILYGDAGDDRLVGAADKDILIGGSGNDIMHGGGGDDIFCFGGDFGVDTVEQLANGKVTLWFDQGSVDNWHKDTMTYDDGENKVTVSGVTEVSLRFGGLEPVYGAFDDAVSEKVFEDKDSGMLA